MTTLLAFDPVAPATLSPQVGAFVVAVAAGMVAVDRLQNRQPAVKRRAPA
jgi:hypothetical protein